MDWIWLIREAYIFLWGILSLQFDLIRAKVVDSAEDLNLLQPYSFYMFFFDFNSIIRFETRVWSFINSFSLQVLLFSNFFTPFYLFAT